ncbi:MAG: hypothetical protein C4547_14340 [Phycisphaerales bacterium]|nr:MAG: hypothetical protein C4547_14340 [Phycisphaerales bacterium]
MDELHQKVIDTVRSHLDPDVADGLESIPSSGRVTGWIAATAFEGQGDRERQRLLWDLLGRELTPAERARVGPIVALTPAEAEFDVTMDT